MSNTPPPPEGEHPVPGRTPATQPSPEPSSPEPSSPEPSSPEPSTFRLAGAALAILAGCLCAYYALPIYDHASGRWLPVRVVVFLIGLALTGLLLTRQVLAARRAPAHRARAQWLFAGICITVVLFAAAYYALALGGSGQMVGIRTKTDALYFAVTVLTTVGFGDVFAAGQPARILVMIQMGFDVLFVATAAAALRTSNAARRAARSSGPASPPPAGDSE